MRRERLLQCRVAHYRRLEGLKIAELAWLVGVHRNHMARIEQGESDPSVSVAILVSTVLGVPVDVLFPGRLLTRELRNRSTKTARSQDRPLRVGGLSSPAPDYPFMPEELHTEAILEENQDGGMIP